MKSCVYRNNPRIIAALKEAIRREVAAITDVALPDVFANLQTHIQKCLDAGGGDFQHISRQTSFCNMHGKYMSIFIGNNIKMIKVFEECLGFLARESPCIVDDEMLHLI
jgi:hypothetical protein